MGTANFYEYYGSDDHLDPGFSCRVNRLFFQERK
jgi:hypothetical protein